MWSFVYPINSSYKYVKKVKLIPNYNPNIFPEIIELLENGGSGGIQTQIPNCHFYIGIPAKCIGMKNGRQYPLQLLEIQFWKQIPDVKKNTMMRRWWEVWQSHKRIVLFSSCLRMWTRSLPYLSFEHCFYNLKEMLSCLIFWRQKKRIFVVAQERIWQSAPIRSNPSLPRAHCLSCKATTWPIKPIRQFIFSA